VIRALSAVTRERELRIDLLLADDGPAGPARPSASSTDDGPGGPTV
jgi:hypothetical protein